MMRMRTLTTTAMIMTATTTMPTMLAEDADPVLRMFDVSDGDEDDGDAMAVRQ